jgi:hypothetical protein
VRVDKALRLQQTCPEPVQATGVTLSGQIAQRCCTEISESSVASALFLTVIVSVSVTRSIEGYILVVTTVLGNVLVNTFGGGQQQLLGVL